MIRACRCCSPACAVLLLTACGSMPLASVERRCPAPPAHLTAPVTLPQPPEAGPNGGLRLLEWGGDVIEALGACNARLEAVRAWGAGVTAEPQE